MGKLFWRIYIQPLPNVAMGMILLVILWAAVKYLAGKHRWWRVFNGAVFLGITGVILYMTVFARGKKPAGGPDAVFHPR